jgi:hypothetical protein
VNVKYGFLLEINGFPDQTYIEMEVEPNENISSVETILDCVPFSYTHHQLRDPVVRDT